MITAYARRDGRLQQIEIEQRADLPNDALWIDLITPTAEERDWVEGVYEQVLPKPDEMAEIEASARFYEDENGLHLHSYFLHEFPEGYRNLTVAFTVGGGRLFSLRDEDLHTFRIFRARARRQPGLGRDAMSILLDLFDIKVERTADLLEQLYADLDALSNRVLTNEEKDMQKVLSVLSKQEDINGKARMNLMDLQRVLSFLMRSRILDPGLTMQLRDILRDIQSLISHSAFLFEKVNFLMDAALGFINIEQNQIIKIFSIYAGVFMPPTMLASMWGMNFQIMPELHTEYGYPFALCLMVLSAVAPYIYFKRRGWL